MTQTNDFGVLSSFCDHVTYTRNGTQHTISCNKGLWSVSGSDHRMVLGEAFRYFRQYFADGEYHDQDTKN